MKLASPLWRSRHGIYYIRIAHQGHDIKRSLGTRDPLLAKGLAYKLCGMNDVDKILAKAKSGEIREWKLKADQDGIEIETDGSALWLGVIIATPAPSGDRHGQTNASQSSLRKIIPEPNFVKTIQ